MSKDCGDNTSLNARTSPLKLVFACDKTDDQDYKSTTMPPTIQLVLKKLHSEFLDFYDASNISSVIPTEQTELLELTDPDSRTGLLKLTSGQSGGIEKLRSLLTSGEKHRHELSNSGNRGHFLGSDNVQVSTTLIPPECVTADSSNELLRKICEIMSPDENNSTAGKNIQT